MGEREHSLVLDRRSIDFTDCLSSLMEPRVYHRTD